MTKILWVILGTLLGVVILIRQAEGTKADDLFFCGDWDCTEFISRGKTLLKYVGRTDKHLSFKQNEDVKILSKPVDDKIQDWVGMVQKRVGLVPKTMVREDQMGKRISTYKFPLNALPVWKDDFILTAEEQNPVKNEVEQSDDNVEAEDTSAENNIETEEAPKPQSLPTVEQATVLPDEVKNQESVTVLPSETVDHVVPEISEATVSASENLGKEQQEVIAPTKSSTLDQVVPTASEVVVEPSEIVDLKDSQDIQDVSAAEEGRIKLQAKPEKQEKETENEPVTESPPEIAQPPEEIDVTTEKSTAAEVAEDDDDDEEEDTDIGSEDYTSAGDELAALLGEPTSSDNLTDDPEELEEVIATTAAPPKENEEVTTSVPEKNIEVSPTPVSEEHVEGAINEVPEKVSEENPSIPVPEKPAEIPQSLTETVAEEPAKEAETIAQESSEISLEETANSVNSGINESLVKPSPNSEENIISTVIDEQADRDITEDTKQNSTDKVTPESQSTENTEETVTSVPEVVHLHETVSNAPEVVQQDEAQPTAKSVEEVPPEIISIAQDVVESTNVNGAAESDGSHNTESSFTQDESARTVQDGFSTTPVPHYDEQESTLSTDSVAESLTSTTPTPEIVSVPEMHPQEEVQVPQTSPEINHSHHEQDHAHDHGHGDHHHHHDHSRDEKADDSSSFILIVKHLSSTLLSFLPEHLQDTIIDVDDALVFTGIIALTLVSICVPYFLIEGFFAVRPLKKKVVELNKSLWKVTTAYENQQEEFEMYKKKALAYDEDKSRIEQLEYELGLLKTLEGKHKNEVRKLNIELKTNRQLAEDTESLYSGLKVKLREAAEEGDRWKKTASTMKEALKRLSGESHGAQAEAASAVMDLELVRQSNETLTLKVEVLEREVGEMKSKLTLEIERRRKAEDEKEELEKSKTALETEHNDLRKICHQYESTVDELTTQITQQENELEALKETLGEDSPLVDIAEVKAKLVNAEQELASLQSRVEATTLENTSLSRNLKESTSSLSTVQTERDEALNKLQVLEQWFKQKEEELRKAVERYEAEKNIRGKDKDDLVRMIEEKGDENKELMERLERFKEEIDELRNQHKNEIRALEAKSHDSWLSLCQAERKAQDARKEAEILRQNLTALTKEKEGDELNGEVPSYPLLAQELIPPPLDEIPSYFGLGEGFIPPPPLPLDEGRGPHRPAPLGRLSPNYSDLDDTMLSPIRRAGGGRRPDDGDYSDGDSTGSEDDEDSPRHRRSPRGGWVDVQHDRDLRDRDQRDRDRDRADRGRDERERRHPRNHGGGGGGPLTSSPIPQGFNL